MKLAKLHTFVHQQQVPKYLGNDIIFEGFVIYNNTHDTNG